MRVVHVVFSYDGIHQWFTLATSDAAVEKLYGAEMSANFRNHGVSVNTVVLPGEEVSVLVHAVEVANFVLTAQHMQTFSPPCTCYTRNCFTT